MARRTSSYRKAGPKVWLAAITMVIGLFILTDDDPQLRRLLTSLVDELLPGFHVSDILGGGARVIDGDTLQMGDKRIRLHGIDAPESKQTCLRGRRVWACGAEAARALERMIGVSDLRCEQRDTDRYGRVVAECSVGRQNINAAMVRSGWAVAYRQYGGAAYAEDEAVARRRQVGIWAGRFVMPWDWRKGVR